MWPEQSAIAAAPLQPTGSESTTAVRTQRARQAHQQSGRVDFEGAPVVDNYTRPEILYWADGVSDVVPLAADKGRLSSSFHYRGPPVVHFFRKNLSITADEAAPIPVAHVSVSPSAKELIFLFFPVGDGTYRVLPVESSLSVVKRGSALIYNLSDTTLTCTLGGPRFELGPNQSKLHSLGSIDGDFQPVLAASQDEDGKWKRKIERKLSVDQRSSMLFVLYNLAEKPSRFKLLPLRIDHRDDSDAQ